MTKTSKRNTTILKERDDVQVRRNLIEQTLLNVKHFVRENSKKVFQVTVIFFLVLIMSLVLYGLQSWLTKKSFEELYLAKNEITKALEEMEYISLLTVTKDKSIKNTGKKNEKGEDTDKIIEESKKEMERKFKNGITGMETISASIIYFFSEARDLAHYELGLAYFNKKDHLKAIQYLNSFYVKNKDHFLSINALEMEALSFEHTENFQEALKRYEKIYNKDTKSVTGVRILYSISRMQEKTGNLKQAIENYKKVAKSFGELSLYYSRLAKKRLYYLSIDKS